MLRTSIVLFGLCALTACTPENTETTGDAPKKEAPSQPEPPPSPQPEPTPDPKTKEPEPEVKFYYNLGVHYYPGWWKGQKAPTDKYLPHAKHYPWLEIVRYHQNELGGYNWAQALQDYRMPLQSYIAPDDKTVYATDDQANSYYYDSGSSKVMETQIKAMHDHGISFVIFNWYWNFDRLVRPDPDQKGKTYQKFGTYLDQAVKAYQNVPAEKKPRGFRYAVAWDLKAGAQYQATPTTDKPWKNVPSDWNAIIEHWVTQYFKDPDYLTLPSPLDPTKKQPVMYILNPEEFSAMSAAMGYNHASELVAYTNEYVSNLTVRLPDGTLVKPAANGIYFIAHHRPVPEDLNNRHWTDWTANAGFFGYTAYNYQNGFYDEKTKPENNGQSSSYIDLARGYYQNWTYLLRILNNAKGYGPGTTEPRKTYMKFHVPMTAGWNIAPWRKDENEKPTYDAVMPRDNSTPERIDDFKKHLRQARDFIHDNRKKPDSDADGPTSENIGIICCWNEFGEGSYIEPTQKRGFSYLKAVQEVFVTEPQQDASKR